jgi:dephospho-CoA kinase
VKDFISQDKININEFDAVIDNNGTIEGLQRQLDEIKPKILASRQ